MTTKEWNVDQIQNIDEMVSFSRQIILGNQHPSGAYVASPTFSQYSYSWLRDGTYIASSMISIGECESASKYITWVSEVIYAYREKVDRLPQLLVSGEPIHNNWFYSARYTVNGDEDVSDWPNFQIDGYGSWLWLVAQYLHTCNNELREDWAGSVKIVLRYLEIVWKLPNSDCWEEFPDQIHPATLACLAGGLIAITDYLDEDLAKRSKALSDEIKGFLYDSVHNEGFFPKYIGSNTIDASLLWLTVPYGVIDAKDPVMTRTVKKIETEIKIEGGVKRYPQDTYYGGGRWIILSAYLGLYYLKIGKVKKAEEQLMWILQQAGDGGELPEQVLDQVNDSSMIEPWESQWGRVASPLLWSHAMFLILEHELSVYNQQKEKSHE